MHQLEKGSWYDADERMFHACFQLLVDYVEFELAGENYEWYDRHLKHRSTGRFGQMLRNPDAGLDFLNQLVGDENPLRMVKVSTDRYSEIRYLYVWYTQIRPKRGNLWDRTIKSRLVQNIIDLRETAQSLDTFYEREDQDKLKHLIDLRSSLWT